MPQDDELKTMPSSERPNPPSVWLVSFGADDDRELAAPEIAAALKRGDIDADTIVWTDGMSDWLPIAQLPELATLLPSTGETAGAPAVMTGGLQATGMSVNDDEAEPPTRRPSTKPPLPKVKASTPAGDDEEPVSLVADSVRDDGPVSSVEPQALGAGTFAAGDSSAGIIGDTGPDSGDQDIEPAPPSGTPSLHQLASLAPPEDTGTDSELLGLGAARPDPLLAPPTIDISNLSGGPTLDAGADPEPVERPDRTTTPPVSEGAAQFIPENHPPASVAPRSSSPSPLPWIVALVACGLAVWAMLFRGGDGQPRPEPAPVAAAETPAVVAPAPLETPAESAPGAAPSVVTAQPPPTGTTTTPEPDEPLPAAPATAEPAVAAPAAAPTPTTGAPVVPPPSTAAAVAAPAVAAPAPSPAPAPTAAATAAAESAPTAAGGAPAAPKEEAPVAGPFDRAAAAQSLSAQASAASSCRKEGDPSGRALVTVTFAASGRAVRATVDGPPFAGTATGGCIASTMRRAKVPAFGGDRVTVTKTVPIN